MFLGIFNNLLLCGSAGGKSCLAWGMWSNFVDLFWLDCEEMASSSSRSSSRSSAKTSSILSSGKASASSVLSSSTLVTHLGLGFLLGSILGSIPDQFQIKSIQMNIKLISYVFLAFSLTFALITTIDAFLLLMVRTNVLVAHALLVPRLSCTCSQIQLQQ